MGKVKRARVTFNMRRIAEGEWEIEANVDGSETRYIKGLKSKTEVDEWLNGSGRMNWLRANGYAK
jgi:hypothetical protein